MSSGATRESLPRSLGPAGLRVPRAVSKTLLERLPAGSRLCLWNGARWAGPERYAGLDYQEDAAGRYPASQSAGGRDLGNEASGLPYKGRVSVRPVSSRMIEMGLRSRIWGSSGIDLFL